VPTRGGIPGEPVLQVDGLNKQFLGTWANRDITFDVLRGEIHCLLGENGAGKTTLSECLYGTYRPDSGTIRFKGEKLELGSPRDAIAAGIGMVHQHFVLASALSVLENVVVGTDLPFILDRSAAEARLKELCAAYGVDLDPGTPVSQLSVGQRQWVEILKALYVGVDLLILDEPTAVLTPMEVERLFKVIHTMKDEGMSVIFITHKLDEVMSTSDRVTTLRKGEVVGTVKTSDVDARQLARMMVGRDVDFRIEKGEFVPSQPVLHVDEIHAEGDRGQEALRGVSLTVHAGEILGLAGVSGNGQRELFDVIVGTRRPTSGSVSVSGRDVTELPPRSRLEIGISSIPPDRVEEGLVMDFRVHQNIILGLHRDRPYSRLGILRERKALAFAERSIREYAIATPSSKWVTRLLSGGNLQKIILARELSREPVVLIASQPTRGLDIGATEYVHRQLVQQRERGAAVLLVSEDLDEIFSLADRVAVIFKGRILDVLDASTASVHDVGLLMAGVAELSGNAMEP
jgi:general nucleoside transport system ATP-binding protein